MALLVGNPGSDPRWDESGKNSLEAENAMLLSMSALGAARCALEF